MRIQTLHNKIVTDEAELRSRLASLPRPLVFTNGVFDVLHRGHVSYLDAARQLGASLVLGLNSDASARLLGKGPDRPLNAEMDRAIVLAGLAAVDLVTLFSTPTPVALIRFIRPDIYVKGGDYDMDSLEETRVVRSWGGQSVAIPFVDGFSTTALVQRIRGLQAGPGSLRKAAFLDRDGVINKDKAYVHRWQDFEFVPGAIEGMRRLQAAGYALVVVTNQSGLARGYFSEAQYQDLAQQMHDELAHRGVHLDGMYHCPHHPQGTVPGLSIVCDCRKPAPGLLLKAAAALSLSLPDSVLIGDKQSDIEAARAAGVGQAFSVDSDNGESRHGGAADSRADGHFSGLADCVDALLR